MYIFKFYIIVLLSFLVLVCGKKEVLKEAENLINLKKYEEAIQKIDAVITDDPGNEEARLLKVRASMLLKSQKRNKEKQEEPADNPKKPPAQAGKKQALINGNPSGFSIMSLNTDKKNKTLSEISKHLKNKNIN